MLSLFDRVKERKIVQWSLAYLAGAYGAVEVLDVLADPFGLTASFQRAVIYFLAFGFGAALVVAWFHAEKGRQRVSGVEVALLVALLIGGVSASVVSYRRGEAEAEFVTVVDRVESELTGPVVAVLPFENLSAGREGAKYIVDGIHAEILTNLSRLAGVNAISRTSVRGYDRANKTVREIAQDLGASAILEGQIQKVGQALRINVTLIDALTDLPIWSDIYDRVMDPGSVFAVQGESAIAEALAVTLAPAEQSRMTRVPTRDQEALELYMLGQEAEDRGDRGDRRSFQEAQDFYRQALDRDPLYADAQAAHGRMIWSVYWFVARTPRTPAIVDSIRVAAEQAIELDPELAAGHRLLGEYYRWHTPDYTSALESFLRARRLDPDNVPALTGLAAMNMQTGDFETARTNLYRAAQLDPREAQSQRMAGFVALYTRRYDDAETHFRAASRRLAPGFFRANPDPASYQMIRFAYQQFVSLFLLADGNTDRAHEALMDMVERTDMSSEDISIVLSDMGVLPVSIGPTMLGVEELRERLREDRDFPRQWMVSVRATLLRMSGEDPEEERRLWGAAGDRITDDQYGGAGLPVSPVFDDQPGTELQLRSQAALFFARAGRREDALAEMNRSREISDTYPYAELTLNAEPLWAMTLMEIGEHEQALDMLEDMLSRPSVMSVGLLNVQPEWDAIREHPRFQALVSGG